MCFGSETIQQPPPVPISAEEKELQQLQLEAARQNQEIYKQQTAESAAEKAKFEELVGMPYADYMAQMAKSTQDINTSYMDRYNKALKGELPVDPGLERSLTENEQTVKNTMQQRLGTGWETSTPGIQALAEYKKRAEELRTSARTGVITAGEQQGYANNPMSWVPGVATVQPVQSSPQMADLLSNYRGERATTNQNWWNQAMLQAQMNQQESLFMRGIYHQIGMQAMQSGTSMAGGAMGGI